MPHRMSARLFKGIQLSNPIHTIHPAAQHAEEECRASDEAVRILNTMTGVIVPQAMILAGFPKKDTANENVRQMIRCHLNALKAKQTTPRQDAPTVEEVRIVTNNNADLLPLTGKNNDPRASATTTTTTIHCCRRRHCRRCHRHRHRHRPVFVIVFVIVVIAAVTVAVIIIVFVTAFVFAAIIVTVAVAVAVTVAFS
jgi:hypothetical protein